MQGNLQTIKTDLESLGKWIDEKITAFEGAGKNSKEMAGNLAFSGYNYSTSSEASTASVAETGAVQEETSWIFEVEETVKQTINTVVDKFLSFGEWLGDNVDLAQETATTAVEDVKSGIAIAITTVSNVVENMNSSYWNWLKETGNEYIEESKDVLDFIGGYVSEVWDFAYENIVDPAWELTKKLVASTVNLYAGVIKGLCQLVESLADFVILVVTAAASIVTGLGDGIDYLRALAMGEEDNWESLTAAMWKGVMGYVAEDHVGNAFESFYKKTAIGQWLDENAWGAFKSDGIGTNIAAGIGYVAGIVVLTIATLGIGGAAVGTASTASTATAATVQTGVSAAIATAAGTGKYTQEAWGKMRDESWKGIQRMYERGEITEDEFNSIIAIRTLNEEQWLEIEEDYKNGIITEEQYEQMKQIREMPDEWRTLENGIKGLGYGVANGVWEGVQYYVGGKLAGWTIKGGSKLVTSAIRVGVDTGFNGLDTPFRSVVESLALGKDFKEAWESQGGWTSFWTNIGIGAIGSVGGELDNIKIKNNGPDAPNISITQPETIIESSEINVQNVVNDYVNNIKDYTSRGITIDKFLYDNGIDLMQLDTKMAVVEFFGDSKLYLMENAEAILKSGNLSGSQQNSLLNIINKYKKQPVGDIDELAMANELAPYMSQEQIKHFIDLHNGNARQFTPEQLDSVFNYTRKGGFEINGWLNDSTVAGDRMRESYRDISNIQNVMAFLWGNRDFKASRGDILDGLDSVISAANYDSAIVTYRGVRNLYDLNTKLDCTKLQVGDSFCSSGYQSSSVIFENNYGYIKQDHNIILKVIVPPNSGTAAYIENISGIRNYGQMEMLIKRDATMTVVGDLEYIDINGITKIIIPVIVQ